MRSERLLEREAQRRFVPLGQAALILGDAGADEHLDVRRAVSRALEAGSSGAQREGEGVFVLGCDAPLPDPRESLEVDAGVVQGRRHQLRGREPSVGEGDTDAREPAPKGPAARGAALEHHRVSGFISVLHHWPPSDAQSVAA